QLVGVFLDVRKLGFVVSATSVRRLLPGAGLEPTPRRAGPSWREFLRSQAGSMIACDFLTVETILLRRFYVLFFIAHASRRVWVAGCTRNPIVVCLHSGPGFDHSTLKPFLGPLADEAQLIFLDHRGQGRSDESTPSRWNLDTWIDDVAAFCDVLGIERPIILGHSFGGMVGLGVAIRYPELPARLVVSSSLARFRPERALAMFEELGGEKARDVAARFFRNPNQESFDAFMVTCFPLYGRRRAIRMCEHAYGSGRR